MRVATVCSGIGAPELAARELGWELTWGSEVAEFPRAVHAHRFPECELLDDMTEVDWDARAGSTDVLVAGTPCQSFSVAGARGGLDDPRGDLTRYFFDELVPRVRPRWVVWENVPNVLSLDGGRVFGSVLGWLAAHGYAASWRVLDAQWLGVPQRRRRLFLVACPATAWQRAGAVLLEPESLRGDPPPRRGQGPGPAGTITARAASSRGAGIDPGHVIGTVAPLLANQGAHGFNGGATIDDAFAGHLIAEGVQLAFGGNDTRGPLEVATAVRAKGGTGHGDFESETFIAFDTTQITHPENRARCRPGEPSPALARTGHPPVVAFSSNDDGSDLLEDTSPALRAGQRRTANANGGIAPAVALEAAVRRLTPVECERLQGFPDDFTLVPGAAVSGWRDLDDSEDLGELIEAGFPVRQRGNTWRVKDPDGPRYRALGNSMAVPVMHWILRRIGAVDSP